MASPQRRRAGHRADPRGRRDRAVRDPLVLRLGRSRAPRSCCARPATTCCSTTSPATQAARHRVFRGHLLRKRVDAVLVLSLTPDRRGGGRRWPGWTGRSPSSAPTVPGWASVRIDDVARRADRDAAPDRAGPPPDRLRRRLARGRSSTSPRRWTGSPATATRWRRPGCRSTRAGRSVGDFTVRGGLAADPAAARGRPASDRGLRGVRRDGGRCACTPPARPACGCPRTCR